MTLKFEENEKSKIELEFPNQSSVLDNNEIRQISGPGFSQLVDKIELNK